MGTSRRRGGIHAYGRGRRSVSWEDDLQRVDRPPPEELAVEQEEGKEDAAVEEAPDDGSHDPDGVHPLLFVPAEQRHLQQVVGSDG